MFKSSITPEEIEKLQLASFKGKIKVINGLGLDFILAVRYLKRQKVIGFDTESRPCFSPNQPHYGVSLLQLSGEDEAFLFRIKLIGGIPRPLRNILASKDILKVGAAVNDDVRGLRKHHDFEPAGFVDLQKMVWEYGIKDKSVKKMSAIILGFRISKSQQLSNWEAEKLSEAQKLYAATDAWVCLKMYQKLLASEKHPLTPEEMLPNPPKQPAEVPAIQHDEQPAEAATAAQDKEKPAEAAPAVQQKGNPAGHKHRKPKHRHPQAAAAVNDK
jgi:ribonuclease D